MEFVRDIVCQVFAGEKTVEKIRITLFEFLPDYETLNLDYASKIYDENYLFESESEMIRYFIDTPNVSQTFYWTSAKNNPEKIMIGANITSDDQLIMSLTFDGIIDFENGYLRKLKNLLKSDIGVISYTDPAEYKNGQDFCNKYADKK
ncbi:hypothetical protein D3C71_906770 [compost metagenome]